MAYTIKSKYIKEEVKDKPFSKSQRIDDLIFIEKRITKRIAGMGASYKWASVRDKYPKEIKSIWEELDLKGYNHFLNQTKKDEKESEELDKWAKKRELKKRKDEQETWVKTGGVIN